MRQNGTNGVTPTRRIVLGGGLAAALWRLGARARADAPAPAAEGVLNFEAAPSRLQLFPPPAEPATAYAYAGAIPGPLIRLRQGQELRLKLTNKLAEPTTLSFPGLRAVNTVAGIGGLTQESLKPDASAEVRFVPPDSGFNLYLPHVGASSRIEDDFTDPAIGRGSGRKGGVVFANGATAPLKLKARPGARVRLRLGSAATARLATVETSGAKILIVAVDGQPSEPFEPLNNQFPMGPGARFELMFDMPRNPGADVRLD